MTPTQKYHETFHGSIVPTLPDRRPQTPDDIPSRYLGECPKCGEEWHAGPMSALDGIPTTACESCGEELCTECPQETCDIGDHSVCRACIRQLAPESGLKCCLKCTGNVLEGPLGEIYQMKRAMGDARTVIAQLLECAHGFSGPIDDAPSAIGRCAAMAVAADISLRVALRTAKERGY